MSLFTVSVEKIGKIWEHTNADSLEMASLEGKDFDFVVAKGNLRVGDKVVYFPVDALLPEWVSIVLGVQGKLAGSAHNRIKTVKLRGNISQGVVAPVTEFLTPSVAENVPVGTDLATMLGIVKYEPPVVSSHAGNLIGFPDFMHVYDIESAQNYTNIVDKIRTGKAYISEKLEGSNWAASIEADGTIRVYSRNYEIQPIEGHTHDWWKALYSNGLDQVLRNIKSFYDLSGTPVQHIVLRGEIVGSNVQGDYYGLKKQDVYMFDLVVNQKYLSVEEFFSMARQTGFKTVPILAKDVTLDSWLDGKGIKEASDGQSMLNPNKLREGIVIKPMVESYEQGFGRVMIKQRSLQYLAKTEN